MDTESKTVLAAIERLEVEKQRRIDEKVEKGEVIRKELYAACAGPDDAADTLERAKASRIAELRAAGEKREIIFDPIEIIMTGVPRPGRDESISSGSFGSTRSLTPRKSDDANKRPQRRAPPISMKGRNLTSLSTNRHHSPSRRPSRRLRANGVARRCRSTVGIPNGAIPAKLPRASSRSWMTSSMSGIRRAAWPATKC
jgi:hypothetical protein